MWRVGYAGAPWELTPRRHCNWQNRFDDPLKKYRTLYCAERRLTALYEVLAPLRPDLRALDDFKTFLARLPGSFPTSGNKLPMEWRWKHELSSAHLDLQEGQLLDVTDLRLLAKLESRISGLLQKYGFKHLDQSVLRCEERELTQAISRILFEGGEIGLLYRSKLDDKRCASLFEGRYRVVPYGPVQPLNEDFRLLREACENLGISL